MGDTSRRALNVRFAKSCACRGAVQEIRVDRGRIAVAPQLKAGEISDASFPLG